MLFYREELDLVQKIKIPLFYFSLFSMPLQKKLMY